MMQSPVAELLSHLTSKQRVRTSLILKQILKHRQMTRQTLADTLAMSGSSIAKYVKTLLDSGIIREVETDQDSSDRRSPVLDLNPGGGCNLTLFVDLNVVHGALVDLAGGIVETTDEPVYYGIQSKELLARMRKVIGRLMERVQLKAKKLFAIGVAMGGALDQRSGISHGYRYASDWGEVPVKKIIEEEFMIPCFVLHDTNAVVAGEKHYGFGVGVETFLTVWLSDGVSLGAVINGEIYLGNDGFVGEFGHIQAVDSGPLCYCGHSGCLETITKESYIIQKAAAGLRGGVHSELLILSRENSGNLTIEDIKTAANNGDRFCKLLFEEVAAHLGPKLSDIINVLNPGLVTFRGSVIDGNHFLFENLQRIILNKSVRNISNSIRLEYSKVDDQIRMKGLGSWILMNYFVGN